MHQGRRWEIRGIGRLLTSRGALRCLNGGGDVGRPWVNGGGTSAARWRSCECEQRRLERKGANQGVSRVVGIKAELTGATDMVGTRRWSRNRPETTEDSGGARWVRERGEASVEVRE
jgi:hypothetical protein